jgi:phage head maturation protease
VTLDAILLHRLVLTGRLSLMVFSTLTGNSIRLGAPGEDGVPRRSIREVSGLFDVSVVTHPAYSSSSAAVARRSMEAWMAEQEEVRCSCQHQAKDADESFAADSARAKSMAVRLCSAR